MNASDPNACDSYSGVCLQCLNNAFGDACERCEPWYYGDAVGEKNCQGESYGKITSNLKSYL